MYLHFQDIEKEIRILVNVTFSYAIIEEAAKDVQGRDHWRMNQKIADLQFSHKWTRSFLSRGGMTRRKITKEDKEIPDDEEIASVLDIGQQLYISNEHDANTTFNFDETAFTWAIGPTHIFCPGNQKRATNIGISNDKMRITAVVAVNAAGDFAPLMLILKHTVSSEVRPDQTGMTVVRDLHKKPGFTVNDGWSQETWVKDLTIKGVTQTHKIIYIIQEETRHVITSQCKAWNDTIRMVLWFDVVMKPIKELLGKMLLWNDNCGSHKTTPVRDEIKKIGIDVAYLPRNMTSELQVLDLVVNGPLKAHIRTNRANRLYKSFQVFKKERDENNKLPMAQRTSSEFKPPKPNLLEGINDLFLLFGNEFKSQKFRECINRTFVKTGTIPIPQEDSTSPTQFQAYRGEEQSGTMLVAPEGTYDPKESDIAENQNEEEAVERAVLEYYVHHNDMSEGEETDTDDEM